MKKVLLTLITIFAINGVASAQMRFGVKGGLNLANISISPSQTGVEPKSIISFHAGIVLDAPLSESISIQPNLLFSQKGYKASFAISTTSIEGKATINYLEIPINVVYHATEALSIGAGPYLGYALSGTSTTTTTTNGQSKTDTKDADFDKDIKRLDFGLNVTAGYEVIEGLIVSANYSLGLANINADTSTTSTIKNGVIGFSVTKLFGER
jgi:Outer membrane protein beta-barrel domain